MPLSLQRRLTMTALLGLAWWFFGNLYEAVVFSPNWVQDSPAQMARLHQLFVTTSPTVYFVPATPLAVLMLWELWVSNRHAALNTPYRRASAWAAVSMLVNAFIVATIITRLFGPDALLHPDELNALCWRWNALNVVRMAAVAATAVAVFRIYLRLERLSDPGPAET